MVELSDDCQAKIRVLVVDDHPVVRDGVENLLSQQADIQFMGGADSTDVALSLVDALHPDVVLVDIKLGAEDGFELARRILHGYPECRVIMLTSYSEAECLREAARAQVHGYLLKSASHELLVQAIRDVHSGELRLSPIMGDMAFQEMCSASAQLTAAHLGLSDTHREMLSLIAEGCSSIELAARLNFSERTVKRKCREILAILGVGSRAQAVSEAYRRGLL